MSETDTGAGGPDEVTALNHLEAAGCSIIPLQRERPEPSERRQLFQRLS